MDVRIVGQNNTLATTGIRKHVLFLEMKEGTMATHAKKRG
jgi:hypothetical protein